MAVVLSASDPTAVRILGQTEELALFAWGIPQRIFSASRDLIFPFVFPLFKKS